MDTDKATKRPLLISHRGAHKEAPENSCQAFEIALDYGVDGIETDVQLSSDGVPVLFHNPTACHVTGKRKRISSYTYEQLQALELGEEGAGIGIPTLTEALAVFARRTRLLIEIKFRKPDRISGRSGELTDKVVAAIECLPTKMHSAIYILSFDPEVLFQVNRLAPQLKCVLNTDGTGAWCVPVADLMRRNVRMDFLSAVCLEKKYLSPQVITWAHTRDLAVMTYCCNTRPQVMRALDLGVDGIMSDKPGWLVNLIEGLFSCPGV
jgi:glycerophosphoryl diester phosphodiesterase